MPNHPARADSTVLWLASVLNSPDMLLRKEDAGSWEVASFGAAIEDLPKEAPDDIRDELTPPPGGGVSAWHLALGRCNS